MRKVFSALIVAAVILQIGGCGSKGTPTANSDLGRALFQATNPKWGPTVAIECANPRIVVHADCVFQADPVSKLPVKFLTLRDNQSYLTRLIRESASMTEPRRGWSVDDQVFISDEPLLVRIAKGEISCFADEAMADLLVLCPIPDSEPKTLILFMRGLCDPCDFTPVVFKAVQKK